jgi:hypothetical protein
MFLFTIHGAPIIYDKKGDIWCLVSGTGMVDTSKKAKIKKGKRQSQKSYGS